MKYILAALLSGIFVHSAAQSNLFISHNGTNKFYDRIVEHGNSVYYLNYKTDTLANSQVVCSYYLSRVNKLTQQLLKSELIQRDTFRYPLVRTDFFQSAYFSINPARGKINIFFDSDMDSSKNQGSQRLMHPRKINFMQLDSDLNITVAPKPILHFSEKSRYVLFHIYYSENMDSNRTMLSYYVSDSNLLATGYSMAVKFLIVDDTGKLLANEFLGWEPLGDDTYFSSNATTTEIRKNDQNNTYTVGVLFEDSLLSGTLQSYFLLDNNLHLIDTITYPSLYNGKNPPGTSVFFGNGLNSISFLPSGIMLRSNIAAMYYSTGQKPYITNALVKSNLTTRHMYADFYAAPPFDTSDHFHSPSPVYSAFAYNKFDNRIYTFASTKSDGQRRVYCLDGNENLGQIVCIDTGFSEKWIRYIIPRKGYGIVTEGIYATDGRHGAIVSGWEAPIASLSNNQNYYQADKSAWIPFIYHIDSNTKLSVGNPEQSVRIVDQFSLYPNPSKSNVVIENVLGTTYSYRVTNSIGQVVISGKAQERQMSLSVQHLPAGLYIVAIETTDFKRITLKFVKE